MATHNGNMTNFAPGFAQSQEQNTRDVLMSDETITLTKDKDLCSAIKHENIVQKDSRFDDTFCADKTKEHITKDDNDISRHFCLDESTDTKAELKRSAEIFIEHLIQMEMNDGEANISQFLNGKCKDDEIANKIKDIYVRLTSGDLAKNLIRMDNAFKGRSCNNTKNNLMETDSAPVQESKPILVKMDENLDKLTIEPPMEQSNATITAYSIEHPVSKKRNNDSMNDSGPLNLVVQKKPRLGELWAPNHEQSNNTEKCGNETSSMLPQVLPANTNTATNATAISELNQNTISVPTTPTAGSQIAIPTTTPISNINPKNNVTENHIDGSDEIKTLKIQKAPVTLADYILSEFGVLVPRKGAKCDINDKNEVASCKTDLIQVQTTRKQNNDIEAQVQNGQNVFIPSTMSPDKTIDDINVSNPSSKSPNSINTQTKEQASNGTSNQNGKLPSSDNPLNGHGKGITPESKQLIKEFYKLVENTIARQEQLNLEKSCDSENPSGENDTINENVFMKETSMTQDENGKVSYNCTRCNVSFPHLTDLQMHTFTHYRKRHRCPACSKEFQNLSGVKRHMIIHTRLKPFSCPKCDRAFNLSTNLRKHYQRMHDGKLPTTSTRRQSTGNTATENNNRQENGDNQNQWQGQNKTVTVDSLPANLSHQILPTASTSPNTCVPSAQTNHVREEQFLTQIPVQTLSLPSIETREQHLSHISPVRVVTSPSTGVPSVQTIYQQATGGNLTQEDHTLLSNEMNQLGSEEVLKIHLPRLKSLQSQITERVKTLGEQFRLVTTAMPNDEIRPTELSPSSKYPSDSLPPWKSLDYVPSKSSEAGCRCSDCPCSINLRQNNDKPLQATHNEPKSNGYPDAVLINGQHSVQQLPMTRINPAIGNGQLRYQRPQSQLRMNTPVSAIHDNINIVTQNRFPNNQLQSVPQAVARTPDGALTIVRPSVSTPCNVRNSAQIITRNVGLNGQLPVNKTVNPQTQLIQSLSQSKCDPRHVDDIWKYFALIHREKSKAPQLSAKLLSPSSLPRQMQQQIQLSSNPTLLESMADVLSCRRPTRNVFDVEKMSEAPFGSARIKTNDTLSAPLDLSCSKID